MMTQEKRTIGYFRLKKYLMEKQNYEKHVAVKTIQDIRKMCPEVKKAFVTWFTTGDAPEGYLCGIHYQNLLQYRNMNPVSAFLAIDWYVKEPDVAGPMLAMPLPDDPKKKVRMSLEEMPERMRQIAKELEEQELSEDTADIAD